MSSLISESEKSGLGLTFNDIFDTFKREVVVHKQPIRVIADLDMNMFYGYDVPYDKPTNFTYTPVTGTYYATIRYTDYQRTENLPELNAETPQGSVRIKVQESAKNFIESGKTEKVTFDNRAFNVVSEPAVKKFLGTAYYAYYLEEIK